MASEGSLVDSSSVVVEKNVKSADVDVPIEVEDAPVQYAEKRGFHFWMCMLSLILPTFLMALDLTAVSTPLPLIVQQLNGHEFEWVGSAYALSATALQPFSGAAAQVFGRRIVMLIQLFFFAAGSAICGAAPSLNILILGRTIQGVGAGGIAALGQIILGDLVPLQERGTYNGIILVGYALGVGLGPLVGGALAVGSRWRWLFYLNLPFCGVAALIVILFVRLRVPTSTWREKMNRLDWIGNFIVIASTTSCVIALTWGGIQSPWNSAKVLVPLILGIVGLIAFCVYEAYVPEHPLVPMSIMKTTTAVSGHIQTFFAMYLVMSVLYYLPVYYQGSKGASPIGSGVDLFGVSQTTLPFGIISGVSIAKSGRYRPQLWFAWVMCTIGSSLLSTLNVDSPRSAYVGYPVFMGVGMGILMTSTVFPVLAPVPVKLNAQALAFYMFFRYLSQIWGVTAGGAVLQNELTKRLPADFLNHFPGGTSIAYSVIPVVKTLPEPFKRQVQIAFAESVRRYWFVLIGVSVSGGIASLFMKGLPLHTSMDREWGLDHDESEKKPAQA